MDEVIARIQTEAILNQADENNIRLTEFDTILQPIIDSCTKDSISAGNANTIKLNTNECAILGPQKIIK